MSNRLGWDAAFGVHRFRVPLGPHACLESLVSPVDQVAYIPEEDDARVLILTNHLYVFAEKLFVYVGCAEVRVVGPKTLVPADMAQMGVRVFNNLEEGIKDCDVVIMLRLQNERMSGALLPSSQEYFESFGLTSEKLQLAKPDAIVMHPGPINRGVEIDSAVVDGQQSVILPQVTFGIAVRMAVMSIVAGNNA